MKERDGASTFFKGLQVLACFETRQRDFTMAELSRLTGFDRASSRRLCLSLVEAGYLNKQEQKLSLTPKILAIAGGYLGANDIGLSAQPILDQFASALRGEISLAVRDGDRAIYVANSKVGTSRVSFGFTVGSTLPLLHTAVGRMILGECSTETIDSILQRVEPQQHTKKTEVDPAVIRNRIEEAGTQGFAYVENEFETGAAAVAVPVGKLNGNEAVVGVTNSINKLKQPEEQERVLDILRQTALAIRRLSIIT